MSYDFDVRIQTISQIIQTIIICLSFFIALYEVYYKRSLDRKSNFKSTYASIRYALSDESVKALSYASIYLRNHSGIEILDQRELKVAYTRMISIIDHIDACLESGLCDEKYSKRVLCAKVGKMIRFISKYSVSRNKNPPNFYLSKKWKDCLNRVE